MAFIATNVANPIQSFGKQEAPGCNTNQRQRWLTLWQNLIASENVPIRQTGFIGPRN
jgi:hypothetical protein